MNNKMNRLIGLLLVCIAAFSLSSCEEEFSEPVLINYDGENLTGPTFPAGTYVTAARFPSMMTSEYEGQELQAVDVYVLQQPSSARIVVYRGGDSNTNPGNVISSQSIESLELNSWNRINLNNAVNIDGSEIWIGLEFSVDANSQIIGCDAGPRDENGDYLFIGSNNLWATFNQLAPDVSVNWNIRGVVN